MTEEVVVYDKNKVLNIIMDSFDDEDVELYDDVTGWPYIKIRRTTTRP